MSIALKVAQRSLKGPTGKQHRRQGKIPAVFYGRGTQNLHFLIDAKDLDRVLSTDEHIVELSIDNGTQELALIQETQRNFLTGKPIHISFLKVRRGEKTWMTVNIELEGEAAGVKEGGDLLVNLRELEIECAPENAPDVLHLDITNLNIGDALYVRDLKLPNGVSVSEKDLDLEIVAVHEHREEAEPALEAPATEVIGETAEAADGEGGAPAAPAKDAKAAGGAKSGGNGKAEAK